MAAALAGYLGAAWFLPETRPVCLALFGIIALLLGGAVPGDAAAGADEYTLPLSDPCYSTLEAYKQQARSGIDAYNQAYYYQKHGPQLEQWRQCCPEITAQVESLRPENPDAEELAYFTFSLGNPDKRSACTKHLAASMEDSEPPSLGKAWVRREVVRWDQYWRETYSELKAELRACCLRHFDNCLEQAPGKAKSGGTSEKAEVGFCLSRFSPEDQPAVSLPVASPPAPPVAAADQPSPGDKSGSPAGAAPPKIGGDEGPARDFCDARVAAAEESGRDLCVTMLAKARQDCQNRLEQASAAQATTSRMAQQQDELQSRLRGLLGGNDQDCSLVTAEMEGLQDELEAAQAASAPRPGAAELAAFPQGIASPDLARMGGGALVGGFLLGLPARSGWRARLSSGLLAALLALLVFLGGVWLAPDTRPVHLLLVLSAALLLLALRALLRVCLGAGLRRRVGLP